MTTKTLDPQKTSRSFQLTDAGLETVLIFEEGFDLPLFAAVPLLDDERGRSALLNYYRGFVDIAEAQDVDLILDTPTWRASQAWGDQLGYNADALDRINVDAVELLKQIRVESSTSSPEISISGSVGPAGDGYVAGRRMSVAEATAYHLPQLRSFARAGADVATALTMTYIDEAIGLTLAAKAVGIPLVLSYTVETDGALPSGQQLEEAIEAVDAASDGYPVFYGINCSHPQHFAHRISSDEEWCSRIGLLRVNASQKSHEELDNSPELDPGDPTELGAEIADLRAQLSGLVTVGGCCGTSHVHIEQIAHACAAASVRAESR
jgi:homocysteine S-methyltransferase